VRLVGHERQSSLGGNGVGDDVVPSMVMRPDVGLRMPATIARWCLAGTVRTNQADDLPAASWKDRPSTAVNGWPEDRRRCV
jgi:hypothetical protein